MLLELFEAIHGKKFHNRQLQVYCKAIGISHNFSTPRTHQQNGVAKRNNRTLREMAQTMIVAS